MLTAQGMIDLMEECTQQLARVRISLSDIETATKSSQSLWDQPWSAEIGRVRRQDARRRLQFGGVAAKGRGRQKLGRHQHSRRQARTGGYSCVL